VEEVSPLHRLAAQAEDEPSWCPKHEWSPWIPLTRPDRSSLPGVWTIYVGNVSKRFCLNCHHTEYAGATASNCDYDYTLTIGAKETEETGKFPTARRRQFFHPTKKRHKGWYRKRRR
jgi:hypothetical protein